jgi:hypothetical protein
MNEYNISVRTSAFSVQIILISLQKRGHLCLDGEEGAVSKSEVDCVTWAETVLFELFFFFYYFGYVD